MEAFIAAPPSTSINPSANNTSSSSSSRHGQIVAANTNSSIISQATTTAPLTSSPTKAGFSRHKKPTLDEVVESVFHSVSGEYGDAKGFDVPSNFYEFYNDPLFRHFLACIVYYYFGFVDVRKLQHRLHAQRLDEGQPPPIAIKGNGNGMGVTTGENDTNIKKDAHDTNVNTRELKFSQIELRRRLRLVGEAYSRLLLNCSNFEHTSEDKHFFEFIFEFTRSVTRLAIDKKYWDEMEQSLSYLFRGYMFNNPALRSKATNFGSSDLREEDDLNSITNGNGIGNSNNSSNNDNSNNNNTSIGFNGLDTNNKSSTNTKGGNEPIDLARRTLAKYRSRVTGAPRARGIRAQRRMRKKRLHEATSNDFATGLLPPEVASIFGVSRNDGLAKRSMSSVREIINARSPLVSMLLPTPVEASANAQMMKRVGNMKKNRKRIAIKVNNVIKTKVIRSSSSNGKRDQIQVGKVVPRLGKRGNNNKPHRKRGAALFDM